MPAKLAELQQLWLTEARKYNVLPLDDRRIELFTIPADPRAGQLVHGDRDEPDAAASGASGRIVAKMNALTDDALIAALIRAGQKVGWTYLPFRSCLMRLTMSLAVRSISFDPPPFNSRYADQITCRDWLGFNPASQSFVRFWMSGYYNAAANSNVLDYNRLQRNSAKVTAYCKKHKSQTLPTAIKYAAS
jgi:hypothetical protein